jgi:diguanylate cyclase (GGDEF)-like protein
MTDSTAQTRPQPPPPVDPLHAALLDSRRRWRDLVAFSADFAFETDSWGRFVLVTPEQALGWSASALIGEPGERLLIHSSDMGGFDPFRVTVPVRHKRTWLQRGDGGVACVDFAAMPILDATGTIVGVRGLGIDVTDMDAQTDETAAALRRGQVLEHILWRTGREVLAPRMMRAALNALINTLGAEGAAVVLVPLDGGAARLAHQAGSGAEVILAAATALLSSAMAASDDSIARDGRPLLVAGCQTRFGAHGGIAIWRAPNARAWDKDDRLLAASAANIIRMVMEHEAIQDEMHRQARTDPLTGLMNRRAFMEEAERHADRLQRDGQPGTLMFADLDHLKPVNDRLGHEAGDRVLVRAARILRRLFRPTDLIARLGGDEFAIWLNGVDHMTAAERAEYLREAIPREMAEELGPDAPRLGMSIGIACRQAGSLEPLDSLIRRADLAMYEVKRNGRGHWRVSLEDPC